MTHFETMTDEEFGSFLIRLACYGGTARGTLERALNEAGKRMLNDSWQTTTRPEPSRLEIAAMAMQGFLANPTLEEADADVLQNIPLASLRFADALIAAAKGGE